MCDHHLFELNNLVDLFDFFSVQGFILSTKELRKAMKFMRLNVIIQAFQFMLLPVVIYGVAKLYLEFGLNSALHKGLIVVGCLPSAISLPVIYVKSCSGNSAAALVNVTISSLIGVIISPLLILLFLGSSVESDPEKTFLKLGTIVVIPVIVGQVIRWKWFEKISKLGIPYSLINKLALLVIIYSAFCEALLTDADIGSVQLISLGGGIIAFQLIGLTLVFFLSGLKIFKLDRADRIVWIFAGTQKTMAMGIPFINVLFDGHPDKSIFTLPLLIFHPMQLIIGSIVVGFATKWILKEKIKQRRETVEPPLKEDIVEIEMTPCSHSSDGIEEDVNVNVNDETTDNDSETTNNNNNNNNNTNSNNEDDISVEENSICGHDNSSTNEEINEDKKIKIDESSPHTITEEYHDSNDEISNKVVKGQETIVENHSDDDDQETKVKNHNNGDGQETAITSENHNNDDDQETITETATTATAKTGDSTNIASDDDEANVN
eukprot:TRINITY_DN490_c0_g2_i3.p1 TRINITY_DN490_c0_g2~~TRINITY_DN490_c0_g2_i3.p1  ORF type:complete len:492 (-),score=145.51 TRINITY_DN490_c0_g2_i3:208-1683(-)